MRLCAEVVGDYCYGDWRFPPNCESASQGGDKSCDYRISWSYLADTDEVEFSIETKAPSNWWTGIGFNIEQSMVRVEFREVLELFFAVRRRFNHRQVSSRSDERA